MERDKLGTAVRRIVVLLVVALALWATPALAQAVVSSASAGCAAGCTATTGAISTTGATLIVVACENIGGAGTIDDTDHLTWTNLTSNVTSNRVVRISYVENPPSNGSHTFSCTSTSTGYPAIAVVAFNGTPTSSIYDGVEVATASVGTATGQPGSTAPASTNNLIVTVQGGDTYTPFSINSSFTIDTSLNKVAFTNESIAMAHLFQTSATAQNPTWTVTTNDFTMTMNSAVFKVNSGGAPATPVCQRLLLGVGGC